MTPYFSVILPIYNVAPYLQRCVQSVLEQSFRDFELILVDDGSTDESPAICDRMAMEHACIRVLHKENGGLSSARNAGMKLAQGTYIWFVDSDDWVSGDALQILFEAGSDKPDIIKCNYVRAEGREMPFFSNVCPGLYQDGKKLLDAAMLTPGNDNLIVAGRAIAAENYAWDLVRSIPAVAVSGQAAGCAAALCVKNNQTVHTLDIKSLQQQIRKQGGCCTMAELALPYRHEKNYQEPVWLHGQH